MFSAMQPDDPGAEQPFISHLIELRDRLIRMLIGVGVVALVLLPFANGIYSYVAAPLIAHLPAGSTMIATQVASPFLTPFKLSLVAAVFLAMPYVLYQLWAFVAPGLYQHEKRLAVPLLLSSIGLFYLGVVFAYFVVFPLIFAFMAGTTPEGVAMMTDIAAYLDFVLALFFAFGVAFEIPVATVLLVAIGAVTPDALVAKRPYVIVGAFVIGMFLTPPDVFSQTLLAVPMWLLFEVGIIFSRLVLRSDGSAAREKTAAGAGDEAGVSLRAARASEPVRPKGAVTGRVPVVDEADESEADLREVDDLETARGTPAARPDAPVGGSAVEALLREANRLRDLDNEPAARQLLYVVLEQGDADQRRVARNILRQLDEV